MKSLAKDTCSVIPPRSIRFRSHMPFPRIRRDVSLVLKALARYSSIRDGQGWLITK